MANETVSLETPDGAFNGYLAKTANSDAPAIVVIQEIFGVNAVMRNLCDWLAGEGFHALCPDLFWRLEPGVDITDQSEAEWAKAFDLFGRFDADAGVKDIQIAIDFMREPSRSNGRVGAVGYCLGGMLAYLTAARTTADTSVGYYGVNIAAHLGESEKISKPLMLHIAGKDEFVPPEAQAQVREGLAGNSLVTIHDYPDQDHAFARVGGKHYDEASATEANARTLAFFRQNLT